MGDACASAAQPNELQQEEEQGDDVQIEVESSEHVLLGRNLIFPVLAAQDELRVSHQVLQRRRRDAQRGGKRRRKETKEKFKTRRNKLQLAADSSLSGVSGAAKKFCS